ncbi:hypothetical protein HDV03_002503, partial [Kappamyces sp. JEL0829]
GDYYAVIFTVVGTGPSPEHDEMSKLTLEKASTYPGYLGYESAGSVDEITISYWESKEAILNWKRDAEHLIAQRRGKEEWFRSYRVRVCKVERDYTFVNKQKQTDGAGK